MEPESSLVELRRLYQDFERNEVIAGASTLYALGRTSLRLAKETRGEKRVLLFVLASIFEHLATRQDGEPISYDDASSLFNSLNPAIQSCLTYLDDSDQTDASLLLHCLVDAYLPPPPMPT